MPLKELAKKLKAQERGKGKRRDSPNNQFLHAKKELHCEKCGYTSTSPYHMKEHKDKCVEGKTFACSQCNKKFAHRMQVYRHEKSEHQCYRTHASKPLMTSLLFRFSQVPLELICFHQKQDFILLCYRTCSVSFCMIVHTGKSKHHLRQTAKHSCADIEFLQFVFSLRCVFSPQTAIHQIFQYSYRSTDRISQESITTLALDCGIHHEDHDLFFGSWGASTTSISLTPHSSQRQTTNQKLSRTKIELSFFVFA